MPVVNVVSLSSGEQTTSSSTAREKSQARTNQTSIALSAECKSRILLRRMHKNVVKTNKLSLNGRKKVVS